MRISLTGAVVVSPEEPEGTAFLLELNVNPIAKTCQESLYRSGTPVIVFGDIEKEYERPKERSVVFRSEPVKNEWGTQALFEDAFVNPIVLHQA